MLDDRLGVRHALPCDLDRVDEARVGRVSDGRPQLVEGFDIGVGRCASGAADEAGDADRPDDPAGDVERRRPSGERGPCLGVGGAGDREPVDELEERGGRARDGRAAGGGIESAEQFFQAPARLPARGNAGPGRSIAGRLPGRIGLEVVGGRAGRRRRHAGREVPAPAGGVDQPGGRALGESLGAPDHRGHVVGSIAEADMEPCRSHVVDAGADAGRAAGGRGAHEPADRVEIALDGEVERPAVAHEFDVGRVAAIVASGADALAGRARLAAGDDADDVYAGLGRGGEQHPAQAVVDRPVPDRARQSQFVEFAPCDG